MTELQTPEQELRAVDIAAEIEEAPLSLGIAPSERSSIELLSDLVVAEHERIDGAVEIIDRTQLANALQSAIERLINAPHEPLGWAARVTCGRTNDPDSTEWHTYARIGEVWVSPSDTAGRTWHDLVVEYDVVTVNGGDAA